MERQFPESDWKLFRQIQPVALDRFCRRVLDELTRLAADAALSHHDRYLAVFQLLQRRDEELADTFNNPRRSTALLQLGHLRFQNLLTEEEYLRFSPETRASVGVFLELRGAP